MPGEYERRLCVGKSQCLHTTPAGLDWATECRPKSILMKDLGACISQAVLTDLASGACSREH